MVGGAWRHLLTALVFAAATSGCTRSVVQQKTPPDPLLISKKPISGRDRTYEPLPRIELAPPATPETPSRTVNPDWSSPTALRSSQPQ